MPRMPQFPPVPCISWGLLTSIGNFPPIQTSCAAYAVSFLIPLTCASRELTASARSLSIASMSRVNMSGCWSYLVEMYCLMAADNEAECVLRNGRKRMLLKAMSVEACQLHSILTKPCSKSQQWFSFWLGES